MILAALLLVACGGKNGTSGDGDGGNGDGDGGLGDGNGGGGDDAPQCGQILATFRDMKAEHPDFEDTVADDRGLVKVDLGSDRTPQYAHAGQSPGKTVSGPVSFSQWYHDVANVNMKFQQVLTLTEAPAGTFTFEDTDFYPLDGMGWGEEVGGHNYHFTTELHGTFVYRGGEIFTFTGDDDVFVFVNGKLALDLGGVHPPQGATIDFDAKAAELGIAKGTVYPIDFFHAERHTTQSNFKMVTTIDCLVVIQ